MRTRIIDLFDHQAIWVKIATHQGQIPVMIYFPTDNNLFDLRTKGDIKILLPIQQLIKQIDLKADHSLYPIGIRSKLWKLNMTFSISLGAVYLFPFQRIDINRDGVYR
ncbi:MAG TPA: hypothetical protein DF610_01810 [Sphingobacterium sp.]|nr:hypothetical protein [Sphingobacterium sp.]